MSQCIDPFVGKILAGWRYDITGLAPEMSGDYEAHLRECSHCRAWQKVHRTIDITLISLATVSAIVFVFAFAVIHHFSPPHALWFQLGAICGFALSALVWLVVAVATPAPLVVKDAAITGARTLHDHLPENLRGFLPEELKGRISGH
jgi:predicted anti-sigma-YlaC factor YlaD